MNLAGLTWATWALWMSPAVATGDSPADSMGVRSLEAMPVRGVAPAPPDPGAHTVFDREWLQRHDPTDLTRLVRTTGGARIVYGGATEAWVSLRGMGPERVAILVDGRPYNSAQGGGVDLAGLDLESVERVEISRGVNTTTTGIHGLSGSINLIRHKAPGSRVSIRALGGSASRAGLRASLTHDQGHWLMHAGGQAETLTRIRHGLRSTRSGAGMWGRATWLPAAGHAWELGGSWDSDASDVPGTRWFPTPQAHRRDGRGEAFVRLSDWSLGSGTAAADLSMLYHDRSYTDPSHALGAVNDRHTNRRWSGTGEWETDFGRTQVRMRGEWQHDDLNSTTDGAVGRLRGAGSAAATWRRDAWGTYPGGALGHGGRVRPHRHRQTGCGLHHRALVGARFRRHRFSALPISTTCSGRPGPPPPGTPICNRSMLPMWRPGDPGPRLDGRSSFPRTPCASPT